MSRLKDASRLKNIKPVKDQKIKTSDDKLLAETTYAQVRAFHAAVLSRAQRFAAALDAKSIQSPIETLVYGSNCQDTLDAIIIVKNEKKNSWRTITQPDDFKTAAGRKIESREVKQAIYAPGDGRVTQHSLLANSIIRSDSKIIKASYSNARPLFFCEPHESLLNNKDIEDNFLVTLLKEILK